MLQASVRRLGLIGIVSALLATGPTLGHARGPVPGVQATLPTVALAELPRQGRETYQLILAGGPFPYDKDGSVFGNRERLLPASERGYYREYTVRTPGVRNRGARRIVCGGRPRTPDACYYTSDHYASYRKIAP
ncbi:MAG: ribonuclease domain-containing protein [Comamonas sp.]